MNINMNMDKKDINHTDSNGLRQGLCRYYYSNGQLMHVMYYVDDILHGLRKVWYSNGRLMREVYYVNGILHGLWRSWDDDGGLDCECYYVSGKQEGEEIHYEYEY